MPELREHLIRALGDRYVIEREIGAGGMATVYLARDVQLDREVALKILDPELAAVMGVERFLAEIRVTAHLQHPNLLPLFDSGETSNGSLFYVMPFVEGESLRQRLEREKQLPVDEAIRITTAIASALDYAHRHHVIHRDLKPENILFQEGQPLVADFGIALAVSQAGGHRITQTGLSLGTPAYMSPEQATGDRAIDGRTDVYSLGAMLYEMLTGEPPHTGTTAQAIIARVLTEKARAIRAVRPAVPVHVEAAIDRALEKLPADRWPTAGEFCDALSGKTTSGSASLIGQRWTRALRSPVVLVLAAIALAATTVALVERDVARPENEGTTIRFTVPLTGGDRNSFSTGPAISPDGRTIAYSGYTPAGQGMVFVRALNELTPRALPGTDAGVQMTFSLDGQWLAYFALGAVKKIHLATGSIRSVAASATLPEGIDWGPGDQIVLSGDNRLIVVPAAGGVAKPFIPLDTANGEVAQRGPHVLTDGEHVLFYSWRGSVEASKIGLASLTHGTARYFDIAGAPVGAMDGVLIYATVTGALFAVPFDVDRGQVTGSPILLPDPVPVIGNGLPRAAISRSGSLVYASGSPLGDLALVDLDGKVQTLNTGAKAYSFPRFSPDGKRIAVSIGSASSIDVWIYDIASKTPTRLTTEGSRNDRVEWTPDGKRVLYSSIGRRGLTALWIQNVDQGGDAEFLEGTRGEQVLEGIISPDGTTLVFRSTSAAHPHDIWYRKLAGDTSRKTFVSAPSSEYAPRFSPNGKWLAYASNRDGASQVYVQPFPPTGVVYQVTDGSGTTPLWSPDGRRIYYVASAKLLAATVQTTPTFKVLGRDTVLSILPYNLASPVHASYDVAPDGKHLLMLRPVRSDNDLIVVHDWTHELRERLKASSRH